MKNLGLRGVLVCVAVFLAAVSGLAQSRGGEGSTPAAVIIYVEGEEFEILDARNREVEMDALDAIGQELYAGDLILTEDSTFVELQLVPSENVVKIAENTNFRIEKRYPQGGGTFSMVYGRVRAKVKKLTGGEKFIIRSESAVAGVRGTDFGVSVVIPVPSTDVPPGGGAEAPSEAASREATAEEVETPLTRVYCFEGEVDVAPENAAGEGEGESAGKTATAESVVVRENEMVAVAAPVRRESDGGTTSGVQKLEVQPIDEEIKSYWQKNDFKATPAPPPADAATTEEKPKTEEKPAPSEEPKAPAETAPETKREPAAEAEPAPPDPTEILLGQLRQERATFAGLGAVLLAVGAALEGVEVYLGVNNGFDTLGPTGWGIMAGGVVFVSGGVFSLSQIVRLTREIAEVEREGAP